MVTDTKMRVQLRERDKSPRKNIGPPAKDSEVKKVDTIERIGSAKNTKYKSKVKALGQRVSLNYVYPPQTHTRTHHH